MKPQQPHSQPQPHGQSPQPQPAGYDIHGRPLYYAPPGHTSMSPSAQQGAHNGQAHAPSAAQQPQHQSTPQPQPRYDYPHAHVDADRGSHVTTTQPHHSGHNFDPRIRAQYANEPKVVHAARPIEPEHRPLSPEIKEKHDQSCKKYPLLNLSEGEFVIMAVHRHPIGMLIPMGVSLFMIILSLVLILFLPSVMGDTLAQNAMAMAYVGLFALMLLSALGGYVAVWVYLRNMFFLTNESIIQEIQHSLFAHREQTVSLGSIEDASYTRTGIIQTLLNYGTIRLSTEGDETTYRFKFVANPKHQVAILNNAVESFKNGRPVDDDMN